MPIELGVQSKIPKCDEDDGDEVGEVEAPTKPGVEHMQQENSKTDPDAANRIEKQETAGEALARWTHLALSLRGDTAFSEGPQLIPYEIVNHRHLRRADFTQGDVQAQDARVGQQEQDSHIHA